MLAEREQETTSEKDGCKIVDKNGRIIAKAQCRGNLFYLDCRAAEHPTITQQSLDRLFCGISGQEFVQVSQDKLVQGLDCTLSAEIDFCETCVQGKQKRASFKSTGSKSITRLELVHSDLCGKMNAP